VASRFNMYGHTACPQCRKPFRCTFKRKPDVVVCDDCGHEEPATPQNSSRNSGVSFAEDLEHDDDPHTLDVDWRRTNGQ
jgi:hypothetical protein